jgi:peptide deformylase
VILPIIKYGSSILRKQSVELTEYDNAEKIAGDLFETLKSCGGIGLSGPQVGISKRVFVIDTAPLNGDNPKIDLFQVAFINPKIIMLSDEKSTRQEGCLSIPGIFEEVERPEKITVRFLDTSYSRHEVILDGINACIFQHEYDHLEGILFTDKITAIRKKLISTILKRIAKENKQKNKIRE